MASKNTNQPRPELSVVTYTRNEEDIIEGVIDEMMAELNKLGISFELIAVNVPSRDNTYEVLEKLGDKYENFYPIDMVNVWGDNIQNGYQRLIGVKMARGRKIILLDSDGEPDPKDFKKFVEKLDEGYDVVNGWRSGGEVTHGFFYNFTSWGWNMVFQLLTGLKLKDKNCGFKAFSAVAAKSMTLYGRNFRAILLQLKRKGFKIGQVEIDWRERKGGSQSFKFWDRAMGGTFDFLMNLFFTNMMDKPFRLWGPIFVFSEFLAVLSGGSWIVMKLASPEWADVHPWLFYVWLLVAIGFGFFGLMAFFFGVTMEFIVSQRSFNLNDFYIGGDQKNITKDRKPYY